MDARGQAEVIGVVMLLGITVLGVGVVVAVGSGALDTAQDQSAVRQAEQTMSLLDARAALVALGRSGGQSVSMSRTDGGTYDVRPDTGRMVVVKSTDSGTTELVNTTLGSVVYERGNAEVAYQGGGVWRSVGAGSAMVSPPEFNYQDATLTLPLVRVTGEPDTAAGGPTARVTRNEAGSNLSVFPGANRTNPLQNGTVTVNVESEYYRGWASYFRSRTSGNVTVFPDERRVELELIARGGGGGFTLSDTPRNLRGLAAEDPIESMSFTLRPKNPNANAFRTLDWTLIANEGGSQTFELQVENENRGNRPCDGDSPAVTVTFDDGGTTHTWQYDSEWDSAAAFTLECGDDPRIHLDLTASTPLSYQGPDGTSPTSNDSIGTIVDYTFAEMGPNTDLDVETGTSAATVLDDSTGEVEYTSSSERVVTFLHITENAVNVTVD